MNKSLDIKIENKKNLLNEAILDFNSSNNERDEVLISKYKRELSELLEIKSFDFDIKPGEGDLNLFKKTVIFNEKEFNSSPLISVLNNLINTSVSGNKIQIEIEDLPEMLVNLDVVKKTSKGFYKSNSFEIFYKKILKAVQGNRWEDFSKL